MSTGDAVLLVSYWFCYHLLWRHGEVSVDKSGSYQFHWPKCLFHLFSIPKTWQQYILQIRICISSLKIFKRNMQHGCLVSKNVQENFSISSLPARIKSQNLFFSVCTTIKAFKTKTVFKIFILCVLHAISWIAFQLSIQWYKPHSQFQYISFSEFNGQWFKAIHII